MVVFLFSCITKRLSILKIFFLSMPCLIMISDFLLKGVRVAKIKSATIFSNLTVAVPNSLKLLKIAS